MRKRAGAWSSAGGASGVPRFYLPLDQVLAQTNVTQFIVMPQDLTVRESLRVKLPALPAIYAAWFRVRRETPASP